jgi:hypothetical protein
MLQGVFKVGFKNRNISLRTVAVTGIVRYRKECENAQQNGPSSWMTVLCAATTVWRGRNWSFIALRRFALRNLAHMNFYNEAQNLRLARHPNASEIFRRKSNT